MLTLNDLKKSETSDVAMAWRVLLERERNAIKAHDWETVHHCAIELDMVQAELEDRSERLSGSGN